MKKSILLLILAITGSVSADTYINYHPTIQVNFVNGNAIIQQNNGSSGSGYEVVYRDNRTYHLGDENFRSRKWAPLYGQCYYIGFKDYGRGQYYLSLKRFGTESAAVFINGRAVGYLPDQAYGNRKRPNYWTSQEWIEVPTRLIHRGYNKMAICASPVPNPEFRGDVDDFQIKNIKLIRAN